MSSRLQVVALVDALGWEYIRERQFLDDVLPYRTALQTVLGFSSGAIPTILTGLMPERHGHWNLFILRSPARSFLVAEGVRLAAQTRCSITVSGGNC